jgi:hypothetical protein
VYQNAFALRLADFVFVDLPACAEPAATASSAIASARIATFLIAASFCDPCPDLIRREVAPGSAGDVQRGAIKVYERAGFARATLTREP